MKTQLTKASRHTKGPWQVSHNGQAVGKWTETGVCKTMICDLGYGNDEANAQRIVDCVNACEGINPKAVPEMLEALKFAFAALQNDTTPNPNHEDWVEDVIYDIKRAITKAEAKNEKGN